MSEQFYTPINEIRNKRIAIWGTGQLMQQYIDKIDPDLDIVFFCDTYKAGQTFYGRQCVEPSEITGKVDAVIIAVKSKKTALTISDILDKMKTPYCYMMDAVWDYMPKWDAIQVGKLENERLLEISSDKIVKYVSLHVPYKNCNMKCEYCYIGQHREFVIEENHFHSPTFIRKAFSRERLGGVCLLNFCAGGETLMCRELLPVLEELYREGHYLQIVTNGTVTSAIDALIERLGSLERLFFKFSFHYMELKKRNMLEIYYKNIQKVKKAGASFTVELVPNDNLIPYIDEIKSSAIENIGALPHLTVPRDDTVKEMKVLTQLSMEKYRAVWGEFDSKMFDFKMDTLNIKRFEDCKAGEWSMWCDLETGRTTKCVGNPYLCNVYEDISKPIYLEKVGNECCLAYCFNCHAYLSLGLIEECEAPTYCEVRDRITVNGEHWLTEKMREIFRQKLYLNN